MDTFDVINVLLGIMGIIMFLFLIGGIIDLVYVQSEAADNANNHCKMIGFDQYKDFSRIGLFSTEPVGIKCEYAERYTDLGIRTNN